MARQTALTLFLFFTALLTRAQTFTEILGRPTDHSVTVSVLFNQKVDLYIEYGTVTGVYPVATETRNSVPGTPDRIVLQDLSADTRYFYRTRYRLPGGGNFLEGPERTFHTQRSIGSTFTFTVESDEHLYDKKGVRSLYRICLANQAADNPDFMFSMGDTFGDDHTPDETTSEDMKALHQDYVQYFGSVCHSAPLFICLGNHEGENNYYMGKNPPENIAVYGTLWRKFYFPNPFPDGFYTGNTDTEPYGIGNPENYYAWTWGDALFVVLDAYRYQCDTSAKPKNWAWTLGQTQYTWLKNTLESSTAKYKFVFAHQIRGQGRGGALLAPNMEWGGYEQDGTTWGFDKHRPGWEKPIHKLFVDNGVNIFFHGHDHLFAHEVVDGVTYQEIPMPSDSTYELGMLANADAYLSDKYDGSGHIRVTVSTSCIKVDFVRAYLPADTLSGTHHNREVPFTYSIGSDCQQGVEESTEENMAVVYPNPATDQVTISLPRGSQHTTFSLHNTMGASVIETVSPVLDLSGLAEGLYILQIRGVDFTITRKLIIRR
jgi:hypothetical protein